MAVNTNYNTISSPTRKIVGGFLCFTLTLFIFLFFILPSPSTSPHMTLVIIPGGGVTDKGGLPKHSQLRLDRAFALYNSVSYNKKHFRLITLSAGTTHKPNPIDKNGFVVFEAVAASKKLIEMGIPADQIWEENISLDTIGNAYFLRTMHTDHIVNIQKLIVVTNKWHMDRVRAIFGYIFSLPESHTSYSLRKKNYRYNYLQYETVEDGLEDPVLAARIEREKQSIRVFNEKTKKEFSSIEELHNWLFSKHTAYASARHSSPGQPLSAVDTDILKSY